MGKLSDAGELVVTMSGQHVLHALINRPAKRNAVNGRIAAGIAACVARAEGDPEIRAVVLSSAGRESFCSGADIAVLAAGQRHTIMTREGGFCGLTRAERQKPWIAAVDGSALGGGMEICLACDMIVASQDASFGLPEVKLGLIAAAGGVFRAAQRLPPGIAFEMLATGIPIAAHRAYELGLVNRLVPAGAALEEALVLAGQIAENAPLAVQLSLAIARGARSGDDSALFAATRLAGTQIRDSADAKEGPRAFLEKRKPVWSGS